MLKIHCTHYANLGYFLKPALSKSALHKTALSKDLLYCPKTVCPKKQITLWHSAPHQISNLYRPNMAPTIFGRTKYVTDQRPWLSMPIIRIIGPPQVNYTVHWRVQICLKSLSVVYDIKKWFLLIYLLTSGHSESEPCYLYINALWNTDFCNEFLTFFRKAIN